MTINNDITTVYNTTDIKSTVYSNEIFIGNTVNYLFGGIIDKEFTLRNFNNDLDMFRLEILCNKETIIANYNHVIYTSMHLITSKFIDKVNSEDFDLNTLELEMCKFKDDFKKLDKYFIVCNTLKTNEIIVFKGNIVENLRTLHYGLNINYADLYEFKTSLVKFMTYYLNKSNKERNIKQLIVCLENVKESYAKLNIDRSLLELNSDVDLVVALFDTYLK